MLAEAGHTGVDVDALAVRLGRPPADAAALARGDGIWRVGDKLFAESVRDTLASNILSTIAGYHRDFPLDAGAPQQWLRSRLGAPESAVDAVLAHLVARHSIVLEQGLARDPSFSPKLTDRQRVIADAIVQRLERGGNEPPSIDELSDELGMDGGQIATISRLLAREGRIVPVEPNRYFLMGSVDSLVHTLMCGMSQNVDYGPSELRPLIGLTRKFLIPFLEYCDREGYTIRDSQGRRRVGSRVVNG